MIPTLIFMLAVSGLIVAWGALLWLVLSRKGLRGIGGWTDWTKRFERLEAEVRRLTDRETRHHVDDEVRRLGEKVAFLENLLADNADTGALPPADREALGTDRQPG